MLPVDSSSKTPVTQRLLQHIHVSFEAYLNLFTPLATACTYVYDAWRRSNPRLIRQEEDTLINQKKILAKRVNVTRLGGTLRNGFFAINTPMRRLEIHPYTTSRLAGTMVIKTRTATPESQATDAAFGR